MSEPETRQYIYVARDDFRALVKAAKACDVAMDGVAQLYGSSLLGTGNPYSQQWAQAHQDLMAALASVAGRERPDAD